MQTEHFGKGVAPQSTLRVPEFEPREPGQKSVRNRIRELAVLGRPVAGQVTNGEDERRARGGVLCQAQRFFRGVLSISIDGNYRLEPLR